MMLCVLLAGCVSEREYAELESRVKKLEEIINVDSLQDDSLTKPDLNITTSNSAIEEKDDSEEIQSSYTYSIGNLSNEEVIKECQYYYENVPYQGEPYDEYYKTLKVPPVRTYEEFGVNCQFYDSANSFDNPEQDVITDIRIQNSQTEMDGTIGYTGYYYTVIVEMIIKDYDRAANIYDGLYNLIISDDYSEIEDDRSSTTWRSFGMFRYIDNAATGSWFLTMEKQDKGFVIVASMNKRKQN